MTAQTLTANFAVLHAEKIKTQAGVAAAAGHIDRTRSTPNADPARAHLNRDLLGAGDTYGAVRAALEGVTCRRNGVLALEFILSTSAGWHTPANLEAWVDASVDWLDGEFGDRLVAARLHLDETTPHIHAVVVPIVQGRKGPYLSASSITGGRDKLSGLQTRAAEAVAHLGLKRGVAGRLLHHQKVRRYHGELPELHQRAQERERAATVLLGGAVALTQGYIRVDRSRGVVECLRPEDEVAVRYYKRLKDADPRVVQSLCGLQGLLEARLEALAARERALATLLDQVQDQIARERLQSSLSPHTGTKGPSR